MEQLFPIICGVIAAITVVVILYLLRWSMKYDIIFRIWPPMIKLERHEP